MRSQIIGVLIPCRADGERPARATRDLLAALRARGHRPRAMQVDGDLPIRLLREPIDLAFLALEGRSGDDGAVQALLERTGVPHTGPRPGAAALASDRARARELLRRSGLPTPPSYALPAGAAPARVRERHGDLGYPVVVRPVRRASPLAVSLAADAAALVAAFASGSAGDAELLVERRAPGPRVLVALLGARPLGAEVSPDPGLRSTRPAAIGPRRALGSAGRPVIATGAPAGAGSVDAAISRSELVGARRRDGILRQAAAAARALGLVGAALVEVALDPDANELILDVDPSPCLARGAPFARIARAAGVRFPALIDAIAGQAASIDQPLAA